MSKILDKYRKEAEDLFSSTTNRDVSWRAAILEAIFRPTIRVGGGRTCMSHLHPQHDKLHLPHGVYIADWRKYRVQDHEILVNFQKRCHAAGLHDPWLRNYAHAYYPSVFHTRSIFAMITTQASWGFGLAVAAFIIQKVYFHYNPYTFEHTPEYVAKHGTKELH